MLKSIQKVKCFNWVFVLLVFAIVAGCNTVNAPEFGGTVKDVDGNEYHTVTIGTQTWMMENLKTTRFNDSTSITMTSDSAAWTNLNVPGYCWYNNDSVANKNVYGALYNWYAVNTGKLAPKGWHVPTEEDWTLLENNVNDYLYKSGSLSKTLAAAGNWAASTRSGAIGNNIALNNSSGFTALPGGLRDNKGHSFNSIRLTGSWWSATVKSDTTALSVMLNYDLNTVERYNKKKLSGLSVRCIKNSN
ncbi:MAG: fibrobacter succinogenes major paralogous domain-containing protein [Paludibacter sp.]|nr:fibrobacter succinogenes major paralogous domain-containing protein [Paludibacter sp.]